MKQNGGWRGKNAGSESGLNDGGDAVQAAAREEVTELIQRVQSLRIQDANGWAVPNPEDEGSDPYMDDEAYDDRPAVVDD